MILNTIVKTDVMDGMRLLPDKSIDVMKYHNKEKSLRKAVIIWCGRDNPNYRNKVIDMFIKKIECDKCTTR